ncbi:DUF4214 domain-containing protein, partial [Pseudovibrio exalbescens]|uniref:DUF4214 domain-containing protein n=1 Tax=Pseudovibrio exalbescens TaxID=197461 RepID=UPI002366566D
MNNYSYSYTNGYPAASSASSSFDYFAGVGAYMAGKEYAINTYLNPGTVGKTALKVTGRAVTVVSEAGELVDGYNKGGEAFAREVAGAGGAIVGAELGGSAAAWVVGAGAVALGAPVALTTVAVVGAVAIGAYVGGQYGEIYVEAGFDWMVDPDRVPPPPKGFNPYTTGYYGAKNSPNTGNNYPLTGLDHEGRQADGRTHTKTGVDNVSNGLNSRDAKPVNDRIADAFSVLEDARRANDRVSDAFSVLEDDFNARDARLPGTLDKLDDPLDPVWNKPLGDISWPDVGDTKDNFSKTPSKDTGRDHVRTPVPKPDPSDRSDPGRHDPPVPTPKPNRNKNKDGDNTTPDRSRPDDNDSYIGTTPRSKPDIGSRETSFRDNMSCFASNTLILLADGTEKPISEIALEDKVMAFDGLGVLEPREVTDLFVHGKRRVLNVDGTLVTPEHPYLMADGSFRPIGELSSGDMVVQADGSLKAIERIAEEPGLHTVYNFTVEGLHTYVAAGLRVHNIKPVLLDLNGNGLEVTELTKSDVFMDTGGDGFLHRTAWAGAGDGILFFDPDGRDAITEKRQFIFTEWDPTSTSDLEALAAVFDSNGDGVLSAADAQFDKFKVLVTNADGSHTSKTLADLGIKSIGLTADASHTELADGSSISGRAVFTRTDGTTGTLGDLTLASENLGHRVEQEERIEANGTRLLTITAYALGGEIAYRIFSQTSEDGLSKLLRYDDDGDGVIDRIQTINTTRRADGSQVETETLSLGSDADTAVLRRTVVTERSADGSTVIIERDLTGGGWFSQREARETADDGTLTITVSDLTQDGSVIRSRFETVSADGSLRIDAADLDGDGHADETVTHRVTVANDQSRTESMTTTNRDGSIRDHVLQEVSADGRQKTISRDLDGDGRADVQEELSIVVAADGSSTSTLEVKNADGSLRSSVTTTQSADTLSKTAESDLDGDGDVDLRETEQVTLLADGTRETVMRSENGDGSLRSYEKQVLGADKVTHERFVDLDLNGSLEANELVSSVVTNSTTQERVETAWTRNADGSVQSKSVSTTSKDGLKTVTNRDIDGDGDIDVSITDVTEGGADGISTRTVTARNQDGSLRSNVVTSTSSDGLTTTTQTDRDGDGRFEKRTVDHLVKDADGATTRELSVFAEKAGSLLSRVVTEVSADRRTSTVTSDVDGDGHADLVTVSEEQADGTKTVTQTATTAIGTVLSKTTTTTSANGLMISTARDLDGDGQDDQVADTEVVLNADGSKTTKSEVKNGNGSVRSATEVTVSDDGLEVTTKSDADGDGVFERVISDKSTLDTDGGVTRTVESHSTDGSLLSRSRTTTSDDGLETTIKRDTDGDGTFDLVESTRKELRADGSIVTSTELRDAEGALREKTTQTLSANERRTVTHSDLNGDGRTDLSITEVVGEDGATKRTVQSLNTAGITLSQNRTEVSADELSSVSYSDRDGNGVFETSSETTRHLNSDGSQTTIEVQTGRNGSLSKKTITTVSDNGLYETRRADLDGDGKIDQQETLNKTIASDGSVTTTSMVSSGSGKLISKAIDTVNGSGTTSTRQFDADGNGKNDHVATTKVRADGSTIQTSAYYDEAGQLLSKTTSTEHGNGLAFKVEHDLNGDGKTDRTVLNETTLGTDGSKVKTITHKAGNNSLLAQEEYRSSDNGLTTRASLDLDGDGKFESVTLKTTAFSNDGATVETWTTSGSGGKASATQTTSGDGLVVTSAVDLDGDGKVDRESLVKTGTSGGATETLREMSEGVLRQETTTTTSADGREQVTRIDMDGDGQADLELRSVTDLNGTETTTYKDLSAHGEAKAIITLARTANGTKETEHLDVDGDGSVDIFRTTSVSYDDAGQEVSVFEERTTTGELVLKSTTTTSVNGYTSTTQTDSNGDGEIDSITKIDRSFNEDGSATTTTARFDDLGELTSRFVDTVSGDERKLEEVFDFDGDGRADLVRVTEMAADGQRIVTETARGGGSSVTTTSADGLVTTVERGGLTETLTRSVTGNGSYSWDNGVSGSLTQPRITVEHKVNAQGIETWEMTSVRDGSSSHFIQQFDEAGRARLLAEAAKLYDSVFDRDMERVEVETLVQYTTSGELNLVELARDLLSSTEFSVRYGTLTDAGFVARAYQNAFGREPTLAELQEHLNELSEKPNSRANLVAELSQSAEHRAVGNSHGHTNNHDVSVMPIVKEDDLRMSFGAHGFDLTTNTAEVVVGSEGNDVLAAGDNTAVFGGKGDDVLTAGTKDDTLVGGQGKDTLKGGKGDDTYVYSRGDGHDIITDSGSSADGGDTLRFGKGIRIEDLNITLQGTDLKIGFFLENGVDASQAAELGLPALDGSITIKGWNTASNPIQIIGSHWIGNLDAFQGGNTGGNRIERIAFEDGDSFWIGHLNAFQGGNNDARFQNLGDGDDTFTGTRGADLLIGAEGNDTLNGGDWHDTLVGGEGNDTLNGGNHNDRLVGGIGDDTLNGGTGDDIYTYSRGDGHDTISDGGGSEDQIYLSDLSLDDVSLRRVGNDLLIYILDSDNPKTPLEELEGSIRIKNWHAAANRIDKLQFEDGQNIDLGTFDSVIRAEDVGSIHVKDVVAEAHNGVWIWGKNPRSLIDIAADREPNSTWTEETLRGHTAEGQLRKFSGEIYLEADKQYTFREVVDDYSLLMINEDEVLNSKVWNDASTGTYSVSHSGYVSFAFYAWNNRHGGNYSLTYSDDGGTSYKSFQFAQSTSEVTENLALQGTAQADWMTGSASDDALWGLNGNDLISGAQGDDVLKAGAGDDTLIGGEGDDRLEGGAGNDTYIYRLGDGHDHVVDTSGSLDKLVFEEGITLADVAAEQSGDDLILRIAVGTPKEGSVRIANYFSATPAI